MMPVIWLLGLSGSGKTTLGSLLRLYLETRGHEVEFIDGDCFRRRFGFSGFRPEDRLRNIDAMREHVLQRHAQGKICIVAAITPYECMRQKNRDEIPLYREVWVRCSLNTLVERDTKGFYARAARGEMDLLTGVSDAFDEPLRADRVVDTDRFSLAESYVALRDLAEEALAESRNWRRISEDLPLESVSWRPARTGYFCRHPRFRGESAGPASARRERRSALSLTALNFGAPGEIRTHGLWLRRPTLYPTELRAHKVFLICFVSGSVKACPPVRAAHAGHRGPHLPVRRFCGKNRRIRALHG